MYMYVLTGKYGKQSGIIRPFERLTNNKLKEELRAREIYDFGSTKADTRQSLNEALGGVQRVPSLLLNSPMENIRTLNLEKYTILECEPLHDLKGHLSNVFEILPSILEKELAANCKKLLDIDLFQKDTKRGVDCRLTAIHLLSLLKHSPATPNKVVQLIQTIVVISEILYADDTKRSPQAILKLYNSTFLHHELCKELFNSTTVMSHRKLFGSHLHALVVHAPAQYEIIPLRSCNSECEERLFGQAKAIAQGTTNRQPHTIVPNILLRLQAKQKKGRMFDSMLGSSSKISKEAHGIREFTTGNTFIEKSFIEHRMASWQAHLQRVSKFLLHGEGVWWKNRESGYEFLDGNEAVSPTQGPVLLHYRDTSLSDIQTQNEMGWTEVVTNKVLLPAPYIRLYDTDGIYLGRYVYNGATVEQYLVSSEHVPIFPLQPHTTTDAIHIRTSETTTNNETPLTSRPGTTTCIMEMSSTPPPTNTPETPSTSRPTTHIADTPSTEETTAELHSESEMEVEEVSESPHTTKLATAINKALGSTSDFQSDLTKLDHIRTKLKNGKESAKYVNKHKKLMSLFKGNVAVYKVLNIEKRHNYAS